MVSMYNLLNQIQLLVSKVHLLLLQLRYLNNNYLLQLRTTGRRSHHHQMNQVQGPKGNKPSKYYLNLY